MNKNSIKPVEYTQYMPILRAEVVNIHTLLSYFKKTDMDYDNNGNILINFNNETKNTPIIVAHLDNVQNGIREPVMNVSRTRIFGKKTGIGFDDKAGIIAAIELWRRIPERKFRIIFTADEEVGGIGASMLDPRYYSDAAYIIEMDRKGNQDLINNSGGTRLCSEEFASMFDCYGFKRAQGTFTDVNLFKPNAPHVNMVNMSIGYYQPHTDDEYLDIKDFEYIVACVEDFLKNNKETIVDDTPPEPENKPYSGYQYNPHSGYNDVVHCDWCGKEIFDEDKAIYAGDEIFCCEKCLRQAYDFDYKK